VGKGRDKKGEGKGRDKKGVGKARFIILHFAAKQENIIALQ